MKGWNWKKIYLRENIEVVDKIGFGNYLIKCGSRRRNAGR